MKRLLFGALLLMTLTTPALSAGLIVVDDPKFWPGPEPIPPIQHRIRLPRPILPRVWAPLEVTQSKVDVVIKDQIAVTKVDQEFYNPNARQMEGTFLFPVPRGAQLDRFTMEINGKPVEAELLAADKARGIYGEIVRKAKDPALLEYSERDLFKVRIFPIEAHGRKKIHLSYSQVLRSDSGLISYVFPLGTEKFSAKPVKNLSVKVEIQGKRSLKSIYSPSHEVEVKRSSDTQAVVGFESSEGRASTDFQLLYGMEEGEFGITVLTHKTAGDEDGYFLLLATPGAERKTAPSVPKDLTFVLDTSGSMAGAKLEQAKKSLLFCIENLNDNDRFEIIRFATETESLFDRLQTASPDNRKRAREFVQDLKPTGGTAIAEALRKAQSVRPEQADRPFTIIFLTDGRPTVGVTDENQIVKAMKDDPETLTRIFCFGIGTDVNTHLLDRIAEKTKAFTQYVLPEEDLELKVSSFYAKIKEPALANPQLVFPASIRTTKLYPHPLPDLFKGQQLVAAGRYSGHGSGELRVEGTVNSEKSTIRYQASFPEKESDYPFIPRLWATRRVGYLLDEIRLHGENKELRDEITDLARRYNIVTPYTAYLILEDESGRDVPTTMRSLPMLEQNVALKREYFDAYRDLRGLESGDKAVASARSSFRLKTADSPSQAIALGNAEAGRAYGPTAPASGVSGSASVWSRSRTAASEPSRPDTYALQGSQSQFIGGRAFYQNGDQWIDATAQKFSGSKRTQVQFGSDDYFRLLRERPEVLPWLALGKNVQFVLNDTLYLVGE